MRKTETSSAIYEMNQELQRLNQRTGILRETEDITVIKWEQEHLKIKINVERELPISREAC